MSNSWLFWFHKHSQPLKRDKTINIMGIWLWLHAVYPSVLPSTPLHASLWPVSIPSEIMEEASMSWSSDNFKDIHPIQTLVILLPSEDMATACTQMSLLAVPGLQDELWGELLRAQHLCDVESWANHSLFLIIASQPVNWGCFLHWKVLQN